VLASGPRRGFRVSLALNAFGRVAHPGARSARPRSVSPLESVEWAAFRSHTSSSAVLSASTAQTIVIVGHYERDGEIKIGDTALDSPSERELARMERMKREG